MAFTRKQPQQQLADVNLIFIHLNYDPLALLQTAAPSHQYASCKTYSFNLQKNNRLFYQTPVETLTPQTLNPHKTPISSLQEPTETHANSPGHPPHSSLPTDCRPEASNKKIRLRVYESAANRRVLQKEAKGLNSRVSFSIPLMVPDSAFTRVMGFAARQGLRHPGLFKNLNCKGSISLARVSEGLIQAST